MKAGELRLEAMRTFSISLTIVFLMLLACTRPDIVIAPGKTLDFGRYKTVRLTVMNSVNTAYAREGIPTFEGLLRSRLMSLGYELVDRDEDLKVEVGINTFEPGNRAVRLFVGFGTGKAALTYRSAFKDRYDVLAELEGGRSYIGIEFDSPIDFSDDQIKIWLIQKSVDQIAAFIKENTSHPKDVRAASQVATAALLGASATIPGQTLASPQLQQNTWQRIVPADEALDPTCNDRKTVNSEVLETPRHIRIEHGRILQGSWVERWTVDRCGKPVFYRVEYTADGKGEISVVVRSLNDS